MTKLRFGGSKQDFAANAGRTETSAVAMETPIAKRTSLGSTLPKSWMRPARAKRSGSGLLGVGLISDTHSLPWGPWPYLITRRNNYELDPMRERRGGEMCE